MDNLDSSDTKEKDKSPKLSPAFTAPLLSRGRSRHSGMRRRLQALSAIPSHHGIPHPPTYLHSAASLASAFQAVRNASASIETVSLHQSLSLCTPPQQRQCSTHHTEKRGKPLTSLLTETQHHLPATTSPPLILALVNIHIQFLQEDLPQVPLDVLGFQAVGMD